MIHVIQADLNNPRHQADLVVMLDAYAQDPMGGGKPMAEDVKARLVPGLRAHPGAYSFLAYQGDPEGLGGPGGGGEAIGIVNCFLGFSTFAGRPLINIHDLAVVSSARRLGVGRKLLDAVKAKAAELRCCKVTLEVRDDNPAARKLYTNYGFHDDGIPHRYWMLKV
jgi:ribosomal protein S18 acetylase RimI-like enzyme